MNPGESGPQDGNGRTPIVLNIVPEKSELECAVCVIWFMCLRVRMSQTEGQFLTIPTSVNGNSTGFVKIYTDSLETISDQIADKIKKTYLETEKYPEISFNLTHLEGESNSVLLSNESRFKASGTLNLHGVEKEIVFYPNIFLNDDAIEFKGETMVRLTDFGIKVPRFLFLEVQDEISIYFNVTWDYSSHLRTATVEVSQ